MKLERGIRAVVFDFDGVILESIDVKTRAFASLFASWPEHEQAIVHLHLENAGMSRYEKFIRIHRDILDVPLADGELERLGEEFARLIRNEMLSCDFVAGARELLDHLFATGHLLFVASGTPEEEVREIVQARGLGRYFSGVYGSPATKGDMIRRILETHALEPREVVAIGDALSDYEGARSADVPFVVRLAPDAPVDFPRDGVLATVSDLRELDDGWEELEAALRRARD